MRPNLKIKIYIIKIENYTEFFYTKIQNYKTINCIKSILIEKGQKNLAIS